MSVTLEEFIIVYSCLRYTNATTCPEIPQTLFYILIIPLVFAIFVISIVLMGLCCCCCFKKVKRGDPKPKIVRDLEAGATPLSTTESSGGLNAMTSPDETQPMLLAHSHDVSVSHTQPQTYKGSSYPKKSVSRKESQTEHLLQDQHKQYGERGDSFRTANDYTLAGRVSADFATPKPFSPQSAEMEFVEEKFRHSTYSGTTKPILYPLIPNTPPRSNTLPNKLRIPETYQTCEQPESPQTDNSVAPLFNQPIIVNDGERYSFTHKQSLDDFSGNINISIVSSLKSNSSLSHKRGLEPSDTGSNLDSSSFKKQLLDSSIEPEQQLSLKERLELVEQEEKLLSSCPPLVPVSEPVEVDEEPNVSDNKMPQYTASEVDSYTESQLENQRPQILYKYPGSTKSYESDTSACPSLVTDTVRGRYLPEDGNVETINTVSITTPILPFQTRNTDANESYNGDITKPDVIPPIKPDIISHITSHITHLPSIPTLDGPPDLLDKLTSLDYDVNLSTGTIHTIHHPDVLNNPDEEKECMGKTSFENTLNESNAHWNLDNSVAPEHLPYLNPDLDVTHGLGPDHMFRTDTDTTYTSNDYVTASESIPPPSLTNTTDNLSANTDIDYHRFSPLPGPKFAEENDIDTSSPLSLVEFSEPVETDYSMIVDQNTPQELFDQQQQQQVSENIPTHSDRNEFVPVSQSDSYIELPKYSPEEESHIGHLSDSRTPTPPQHASLPSQDHDTIVIDASVDVDVTLPMNYIANDNEVLLDTYEGNDAVPLNYESIIPVKEDEIELPQPDNSNPLKEFEFPEEPVLPQRSVEYPITFSDYIAREWVDAVPLNYESIIPVKENEIELLQSDNSNPLKELEFPEEPVLPQRSVEYPITFSDYIAREWVDAVPLNYESIIPVKENEIELLQSDNSNPLKELEFPEEPVLPQRSVEYPITFSDYIAREWVGTSETAERVRNGYKELEKMDYTHLMSIRGDNYCAIRSTLFQTFCVRDFNVCSFLANMKPPVEAKEIVAPMMQKYPFLKNWSFANKKSFLQSGDTQKVLEVCVGALAFEIDKLRLWEPLNRMVYIYQQLNTQPETFDFSLMEALKFYMFITAAKYWELFSNGHEVPESICFLFLREDSNNLEEFLVNHLNAVGDSGGLEMVEMFLLGLTLDLQIKVTRISSFGKEDFISYFPQGNYPPERIISLSAEDDRHYNALSTLLLKDTDDFLIPESKISRTHK